MCVIMLSLLKSTNHFHKTSSNNYRGCLSIYSVFLINILDSIREFTRLSIPVRLLVSLCRGHHLNQLLLELQRKSSHHLSTLMVSPVKQCLNTIIILLPGPLDTAVDVGSGSGQGTVTLAPYFKRVHGFDISEAQIEQAKATRSLPNVTYIVSPVERLPFADGSVQLLTAGAALHWFDLDAFLPEARRVLCDNGVMAVYLYHSMKPLFKDQQKDAEFDEIYEKFNKTEKSYSVISRVQVVVNEYKDVTFPFEEVIRCPYIRCTSEGKLSDVVNYSRTFSGFQNFLKVDRQAAEECLDSFRNKLYEIGASCNYSAEDSITLYTDYKLILCRKTSKSPKRNA